MKITLRPEFLNQIREEIAETRKVLEDNKNYRKTLFKQISAVKLNIRAGERLSSLVVEEKLDSSGYMRDVITEKQKVLKNLREQLVSAEIFREIALSKFRVLHTQLDKFNAPFNPSVSRLRRN